MKAIHLLIAVSILFLYSCAPQVTTKISRGYAPLAGNAEIRVYDLKENAPASSEFLGIVKVSDNGLSSKCGWEEVVEKAKAEARSTGGNAIKIINHVPPSFWGSSCHQITATILKVSDFDSGSGSDSVGSSQDTALYVYSKPLKNKYPHWRAGLCGGWSYRTAKMADDMTQAEKEYITGLRSGFHYGADAAYYFSEVLGIGVSFKDFRASNREDNWPVNLPDGTTVNGTMSDKISITFIGPSLNMRFLSQNKKNALIMNVGIGYMGYTDKSFLINQAFTMKGSTAGFLMELGYDIGISKYLALGLQASLIGGTLKEFDFIDATGKQRINLPEGSYESLTRVDLTVGLRFVR